MTYFDVLRRGGFIFALLALSAAAISAQTTVVSLFGTPGSVLNTQQMQEQRGKRTAASRPTAQGVLKPRAITFVGDVVFPHFIDGASWQTSITLVNLELKTVHFEMFFVNDNGTDMLVPLEGVLNPVRGLDVTLGIHGSITIATKGISPSLSSGWALMGLDDFEDAISGMGVFRSRVAGRADFEAAIPFVSAFQGHFVIPYDNTNGYFTGIAITNPNENNLRIPVTIYDELGNVVGVPITATIRAFGHTAFLLNDTWQATAGRRGTIEFRAPGFGVGALGLRFNPTGAFTSFNTMQSLDWAFE